jgi:hypothetical protein
MKLHNKISTHFSNKFKFKSNPPQYTDTHMTIKMEIWQKEVR